MTAEDDRDELAVRLDRLEAIEAVRELKHRYLRACDTKDVTGFRACFDDGPVDLDYGPMGAFDRADTLTELFERFALRRDEHGYRVLDMHHALHASIDAPTPDEARGRWSLRFRQVDRDRWAETLAAIEYDDRYVRRDGEWRIQASRARQLWTMTRPLPDDAHVSDAIDG